MLSWLLQRIESEIFIRRVAKRFSEQYPNAPIFTIHDSVITTHQYENALTQLLRNEICSATQFIPSLIAENWNENNVNKHSVSNYYYEEMQVAVHEGNITIK